jgi:hypothetical protein
VIPVVANTADRVGKRPVSCMPIITPAVTDTEIVVQRVTSETRSRFVSVDFERFARANTTSDTTQAIDSGMSSAAGAIN